MSKQYKLINLETKEETICNLVTIDGFDYYVISEEIDKPTYIASDKTIELVKDDFDFINSGIRDGFYAKVIATNNPNIDSLKIIKKNYTLEDAIKLGIDTFKDIFDLHPKGGKLSNETVSILIKTSVKTGYKFGTKVKETYQYTEEDLMNFAAFCSYNHTLDDSDKSNIYWQPLFEGGKKQTSKELLSIWKEQQPKILYYE